MSVSPLFVRMGARNIHFTQQQYKHEINWTVQDTVKGDACDDENYDDNDEEQ